MLISFILSLMWVFYACLILSFDSLKVLITFPFIFLKHFFNHILKFKITFFLNFVNMVYSCCCSAYKYAQSLKNIYKVLNTVHFKILCLNYTASRKEISEEIFLGSWLKLILIPTSMTTYSFLRAILA